MSRANGLACSWECPLFYRSAADRSDQWDPNTPFGISTWWTVSSLAHETSSTVKFLARAPNHARELLMRVSSWYPQWRPDPDLFKDHVGWSRFGLGFNGQGNISFRKITTESAVESWQVVWFVWNALDRLELGTCWIWRRSCSIGRQAPWQNISDLLRTIVCKLKRKRGDG